MRFLRIVVILSLFLAPIEALAEDVNIPTQDIIIFTTSPIGLVPTLILKGSLNPEKEGIQWWTLEEWDKIVSELESQEEEPPPQGEHRETFGVQQLI